ncbi:type VI secretion system secreted protein VgrG [Sinobacterium caligoides]|uniref:Type VI secretion system secreted protein VgrG n=1 Tax=Sinobacterium caligoides TaxID=933926 RepID=A0A3N2DJS8_9GAMM|nr:type VI secretion system tip protein TssI/VgrG [Sinobacterium caligoides]ROS00050.1 type VI secretion system secreted protein VgrG [Sinobacterium caligoides]
MSNIELSQKHRLIELVSGFSSDVVITQLSGEEGISEEYEYDVELLSDDKNLGKGKIVGGAIALNLSVMEGNDRPLNGYVSQFSMDELDPSGLRKYRLKLVSPLWFAQYAMHNRIFQGKTTKDIVEQVIKGYGLNVTLSFQLNNVLSPREYCVQYDEHDLMFLTRILAEDGIGYFYKMNKSGIEIVFFDGKSSYIDCSPKAIEFKASGLNSDETYINTWYREQNYHPSDYTVTDSNSFSHTKKTVSKKKGASSSQVVKKTLGPTDDASLNYVAVDDFSSKIESKMADSYLRHWLESEESRFETCYGQSGCGFMAPGHTFKLTHAVKSEEQEYLIVSVRHSVVDVVNSTSSYINQFKCVPATKIYRPSPRNMSRAPVPPQLATVKEVASKATKDPYKQVKVVFAWDVNAESIWLRVAQPYAGKDWGAVFVPRVGQEVIVNYMGGDINRPVVTGAVYNADNKFSGYTETQSGIKSMIDGEYNELRFDDKKGKEEVYFQAGRDHNFLIKNDQKGEIKGKETLTVEKDSEKNIKANSTRQVDGNSKSTIKGKRDDQVDGNNSVKIGGNNSLKVSGKHNVAVTGSISHDSKGGISIKALTSIELKVGPSSIKISNAGVDIKGLKVTVAGDAMTQVKGGGMLMLKGGVTLIN